MAKQSHDLGVQKRRSGQRPQPKNRLAWLRVKRRHPGPLPVFLKSLDAWVKAGRPRIVHEKGDPS